MVKCSRCQHKMPDGTSVCEKCGLNLEENPSEQTSVYRPDEGPNNIILSGWGKATFDEQDQVIIHVKDAGDPIVVQFEKEFLIGRSRKGDDAALDLDLAPYGGQKMGVSRVHAALRHGDNELQIVDLGSTNGTYLNEEPIPQNRPHTIRNGDMIRLGQLVLYVYFK